MNSQTTLRRLGNAAFCVAALATITACDDKVHWTEEPGGETQPEDNTVYDEWITFKPEGATCADGTQYKYFVKFREGSENVLVLFEGGGACWDYETCSNAAGTLAARGVDCVVNPTGDDCLPDNYADTYYGLPGGLPLDDYQDILKKFSWLSITDGRVAIDTVLPLANSANGVSPMGDWNLVFVPYCTADLYAGNRVAEYVDPTNPENTLTFRHVGLPNTLKVASELNELFPNVPEFAMNGCSAGGAGTLATFPLFRSRMEGIQKAFVFADAGPFFPTPNDDSPSAPLHNTVRESWNASSIFELLREEFPDKNIQEPEQMAEIYRLYAEHFPDDRFSVAHTQTDYNYSLYSYITFHGGFEHYRAKTAADAKRIYEYWKEDNDALVDLLEELPNFSYYMPFWRQTNDSHCISLIGIEDLPDYNTDPLAAFLNFIGSPSKYYYSGTEIEHDGRTWTYGDHVRMVLEDTDVINIFELDGEGPRMYCTPDYYDEDLCKQAFGESTGDDGDDDGGTGDDGSDDGDGDDGDTDPV